MKVLLFDIETSYMITRTFSLYPESISHTDIIQDWYMISAAWKWYGEKTVHSKGISKVGDDKALVKELAAAIEEADLIVYHNGDKFDWKKLNTRILQHRLKPLAKPKSLDTLKQVRKHFAISSNRLDYVATFLGIPGKIGNIGHIWKEISVGDLSSMPKMLKYNIQDVKCLEDIYTKLRGYIDTPVEKLEGCVECGFTNLQKGGTIVTRSKTWQRLRCLNCGKWNKQGVEA